ncbi:tyrosine-type recombinase/integrase [Saccharothrix syringae]|uniref:Site-specific integrase n=1 Tax=Saccharothrix syringae TaxID=103733 RepID=A0A5Q0H974_SACSY|nr:site-specific integrase [Saccharothrix syringae]QFZ22749.1 site-specific integrase [Saccharothrix syringae]
MIERPGEVPGWELQDAVEEPVAPVQQFLSDFAARDSSPSSVRSYAMALLRWSRMLWTWNVAWDQATSNEVRDYVLWLRQARKHRPTEPTTLVPGSVNTKTGKRYPGDGYAPRTINHNLAVLYEFYAFHLNEGRGPVRNPVPERRDRNAERFAAHHNPLQAFPQVRRGAYRQKEPKRTPRSIPDAAVDDLFAGLNSHRDRAMIAFYLSSGARPSELITMTNEMVDPGNQAIAVIRKGSRSLQWLPASPDAFVWLRLAQAQMPEELAEPRAMTWWTLRRPYRPMNYFAVRRVFQRVNQVGGTNWTLHDLRHTAATRMVTDPSMSLTDVQTILGHAWVTSTQIYTQPRQEEVFAHAQAHFKRLREKESDPAPPVAHLPATASRYNPDDLNELFGDLR